MAGVDFAHTRSAQRRRAAKVARLAEAAVAAGLSLCELRTSHPDARVVRPALLAAAGATSASDETWAAVYAAHRSRLLAVPGVEACTSCGVPVLRAVARRSPVVIVDPLPHPSGTLRLSSGRPALADPLDEDERAAAAAAGLPLFRGHHLACPLDQHARRRLPRQRRCPVCQHGLAWWVRDRAYVVHPACDSPDDLPRTARATERTSAS